MTRHKAYSHSPKSQAAGYSKVSISAESVVLVVFFALVAVAVALPACSNDAGENRSTSDAARVEAVEAQSEGDSAAEGQSGEHGASGEAPGEEMDSAGESAERAEESEGAGSEDGEESGVLLTLDDTFDTVRNGARLILNYDAGSNAFVGTVSNTTGETLRRVRVEVHLSNGTELGPTTPTDLAPGETVDVTVAATEEPFTGWTPHAEVDRSDGGGGEHGSGGEGGGEHNGGGEGGGEHGEGGEGRGEGGGG